MSTQPEIKFAKAELTASRDLVAIVAEAHQARNAAIADAFTRLGRWLVAPLKRRIATLSRIEAHAA